MEECLEHILMRVAREGNHLVSRNSVWSWQPWMGPSPDGSKKVSCLGASTKERERR